MKTKLYKLETEEVWEVTCQYYIEDEDDDGCYQPKGTKTYYFKNGNEANDFFWKYKDEFIKRYNWGYIRNASSPYLTIREKYVEVSEEEVRKILEA